MTMYVLIENKPTGKVTASLIGWPSMTVQGNTEVEAMNALRQLIALHLKDARIVPLDIETERTWLQTAGVDLIKIYFDFWNAFCVSVEFGSYAARNMFP